MKKILLSIALFWLFLAGCGGGDGGGGSTDAKSISSVNGDYFKYVMGTATVSKPLAFIVRDGQNNPMANQWVHFQRIIGDGHILTDSVLTGSNGIAIGQYTFDGSLGDAELMAYVRGVDTSIVSARASVLIPGNGGQGQYIKFDEDTYKDITSYNGSTTPDTYTGSPIIYVNYESTLGVVFMVWDLDLDYNVYDSSDVYGVIVNTTYAGKIADSIGIGSTYKAVVDYYGTPDSVVYDPVEPAAWRIRYLDKGMTLFGAQADTSIFEIHLTEVLVPGKLTSSKSVAMPVQSNGKYRLHH